MTASEYLRARVEALKAGSATAGRPEPGATLQAAIYTLEIVANALEQERNPHE